MSSSNRRQLPLPVIDLAQLLGPNFRLPVQRSEEANENDAQSSQETKSGEIARQNEESSSGAPAPDTDGRTTAPSNANQSSASDENNKDETIESSGAAADALADADNSNTGAAAASDASTTAVSNGPKLHDVVFPRDKRKLFDMTRAIVAMYYTDGGKESLKFVAKEVIATWKTINKEHAVPSTIFWMQTEREGYKFFYQITELEAKEQLCLWLREHEGAQALMAKARKSTRVVSQCDVLKRIVSKLLKDHSGPAASRKRTFRESFGPELRAGTPSQEASEIDMNIRNVESSSSNGAASTGPCRTQASRRCFLPLR